MNPIIHIRYMLLSLLLLASFIGATATADRVVVTSGRVVYDAFGRAVKVYHPTVDTDSVDDFIAAIDTVDPTITKYDVLDRPVRVIYPDGTETNTSYRVEGHALVTHVTDALDNETETHVSGSGHTLKSIQFDGSEQIVTQFTYDGIGRLVEVLDADTNVTVSEYDMGDRRVRVSHPASGETTFTYDVLGNVLTRQTANLRDSALFIEYGYDRGRLISVNYPEHPENNVRYYYGGANDQDNAKGRLCLRLDATGGEQYAYDNMGNVKETVRTVTVPNEDVGTFKTEFEYDSFGKLLSLTYPDGEKVCYWYDGSGQLTEVYVKERKNGYRYVEEIGYDKFGDRVYMRYGNGAETEYAYNDEMRRLDSLSLASPHTTMKRIYGYDAVGNILSVTNSGTGLLHDSPVSHAYVYDNLYRLTEAHGTTGSAQTGYDLAMSYDKMYRITGKTQSLRQTGIQFAGTLNAGYDLSYAYDRAPGRRFRMSSVSDVNYRTVGDPEDGDYIDEEHFYEYDPNGNIIRVNTSRMRADGSDRELTREERFRWDEENRLMAISQDGYVSNYWYDGDGERVIKEHGGNQAVFVNSEQDGVLTDTRQFTIYPSAYLTVHNGSWYTKHVYIGSERIASRMGTMLNALSETFEANAILAGENVFEDMDYDDRCDTLARVMRSNYAYFDLPYNGYNRHGEEMVSTPPQSGDPGILGAGGVRHYWMLADADAADADGEGGGPSRGPRRAENVNYNGNRYFYHSDHLGSSSLITDASGNVTQQLDYLPYGEVFLEKRADVDYYTPYRFNGKELDEETGLYYYGARYYNPRLSIWYATDLLQEKYPEVSTYLYCHGNPICIYDKDGNDDVYINNNHQIIKVVQGSPNICVVMPNGKRVLFSNIEFGRTSWLPAGWNCGNRQIVANVFGYYAKKMGITNVGAEAKLGANNVLAFFSPQNNHIWLSPGHDGTMNNLLVNKYNLMNVAYHESLHDLDKKNQIKLNHLRHAQITLMASQHPLYMKCTQEYKIGEAAAFAQYVMNAYYEGSKNEALRLIDEYNNSNLGISFFFNEEKRRMEVVGTKHFVKYKKAKSPINL